MAAIFQNGRQNPLFPQEILYFIAGKQELQVQIHPNMTQVHSTSYNFAIVRKIYSFKKNWRENGSNFCDHFTKWPPKSTFFTGNSVFHCK
jgi:hypothetical protein